MLEQRVGSQQGDSDGGRHSDGVTVWAHQVRFPGRESFHGDEYEEEDEAQSGETLGSAGLHGEEGVSGIWVTAVACRGCLSICNRAGEAKAGERETEALPRTTTP